MPGEFDIIRRFFKPLKSDHASVSLGIGDDCALVSVPLGTELALSLDTLVEGVHFLPTISPDDLAWRIVSSSVSDLAAMGATPRWLTLGCTLSSVNEDWLATFGEALHQACSLYQLQLIGGDTTSGPCHVFSAQVHGFVPSGKALQRNKANIGDLIVVSGTLGDSRAGLAMVTEEIQSRCEFLLERYHRPSARIALGQYLIGKASAAIDISDGLLADLGHLLEASSVSARIDIEKLPMSPEFKLHAGQKAELWALTGGEDFELCFTIPESELNDLNDFCSNHAFNATVIGKIVNGKGMRLVKNNTLYQEPSVLGFDHFESNYE